MLSSSANIFAASPENESLLEQRPVFEEFIRSAALQMLCCLYLQIHIGKLSIFLLENRKENSLGNRTETTHYLREMRAEVLRRRFACPENGIQSRMETGGSLSPLPHRLLPYGCRKRLWVATAEKEILLGYGGRKSAFCILVLLIILIFFG